MQANIQKINRRVIDFLHKYATEAQIISVAKLLDISTEDKAKEREEKS